MVTLYGKLSHVPSSSVVVKMQKAHKRLRDETTREQKLKRKPCVPGAIQQLASGSTLISSPKQLEVGCVDSASEKTSTIMFA